MEPGTDRAIAQKNYEDAIEMLSMSKPSHALFSIRQSLEVVVHGMCDNAGVATKNENGNIALVTLIDSLLENRLISPNDAEILHRIRILGNMGVHHSEGSAPTMEQAQEGVYLLSTILNRYESLEQNLSPRQQALMADQCIKRGKITQAEKWCQKVLTDGSDSIACAMALSSLCCISGTDHTGATITDTVLKDRADKGSVVSMGALILWYSKQTPHLFQISKVSSIEQGQYVVGFITSRQCSPAQIDFGYKLPGRILVNQLVWEANDYIYDANNYDAKKGLLVGAFVESQADSGVELHNGTLYKKSSYETILSVGQTILPLYEQILVADPELAESLRSKVNNLQFAMEKAESLRTQIELETNPPKTEKQIEGELKKTQTSALLTLSVMSSIISCICTCILHAKTIKTGFTDGGNAYMTIWVAAFCVGYGLFCFLLRSDGTSFRISKAEWLTMPFSAIIRLVILTIGISVVISNILFLILMVTRKVSSFFLFILLPIACAIILYFIPNKNTPVSMCIGLFAFTVAASIVGALSYFLVLIGLPLVYVIGIIVLVKAFGRYKECSHNVCILLEELEQLRTQVNQQS